MAKRSLTKVEAQEMLSGYDGVSLPNLEDQEDLEIRNTIIEIYNDAKTSLGLSNNSSLEYNEKYKVDVFVGVKLKSYFDSKPWFNLRVASDITFWIYLSVVVVPNIVADRYSASAIEHFYNNNNRIWLHAVWRYAYLAWIGDQSATKTLLEQPQFSTDSIQALVERSGRKGTPIDVYKEIIHVYGSLTKEQLSCYKKPKGSSENLLRAIMKKNTARIVVTEPVLAEGGIKGYVSSLFASLNISVPVRTSPDNVSIGQVKEEDELLDSYKENPESYLCLYKNDYYFIDLGSPKEALGIYYDRVHIFFLDDGPIDHILVIDYNKSKGVYILVKGGQGGYMGRTFLSLNEDSPFGFSEVHISCGWNEYTHYIACKRRGKWGLVQLKHRVYKWLIPIEKESLDEIKAFVCQIAPKNRWKTADEVEERNN